MDSSDADPRYMNNASGLKYNIYTTGAYTQIWGARETAGNTYCNSSAWTNQNLAVALSPFANSSGNYSGTFTVYGRVFSGQTTMPVGSYSSSFTATTNSQSRFVLAYRNCCFACNNTGGGFQTTSAPFTVAATVVPSCFVSATDLDFGTDSLLSGNVDRTSTVSVTCGAGQAYGVRLNQGTTSGGTTTTRLMKHASSSATISARAADGKIAGGVHSLVERDLDIAEIHAGHRRRASLRRRRDDAENHQRSRERQPCDLRLSHLQTTPSMKTCESA
jgi:spore coat protein U domain-containing protein, fimbrial subunit CupE1/2/3/6